MVRLAKIVKSNSHVDYVGRVIDVLDVDSPPAATDYGFAQFVSIPLDDSEIIGVIYNSQLANPDYGNFGPRLSPASDLSVLSPDYLNEQGTLVGILLLGWRDISGNENQQAVPRRVIPVNQDVYALDAEGVRRFHQGENGRVQLHYYSQVITHAGAFAVPLIEAIIEQLETGCAAEEWQRLCVLKQALVWQRTVGGMRL
ncbi:MAG: hypothetical protein AUG51_07015 [Acidobacteria bacterium 13_1_20CM_3_53_8]|nr:MAG: hypothetical protein AUG51_07015 [Acidobacteria bacterium 13_1_20CM_3_53_8]